MRDKHLADALAAIYRCLELVDREQFGAEIVQQFDKDMETIKGAVEGMGGSVE